MSSLKIKPELWGSVECLSKEPGGFRGNATLATHEFVNTLDGHMEVGRKGDLRKSQRFKELLEKDFAWVSRDAVSRNHLATPQW